MRDEPKWMRVAFASESAEDWHTLFHQIDTVSKAIEQEYEKSTKPLVFDISALSRIDSLFISVLVRILRSVPYERVAILAPNRALAKVFFQLGMHALVDICSLESEINAKFSEGIPHE
jgi:anti-anti-sigma regulatory factor